MSTNPDPADGASDVTDPTSAAGTRRVVLDVGGHAPLLPEAREAFLQALDQGWADPRRLFSEARRARMLLDGAREAVAAVVGARTEQIDLAPSHVAALHAGVRSVARGRRRVGPRIVTSAVERAAVLQAAAFSAGEDHVVVPVDASGRVDADAFRAALVEPGTALAVLQHANGEVGTLQPVDEVHDAARAAGVPLLVDAGASLGHAPVPPSWDVLAADAGDWGGPAGIGILATRAGVRRSPDWPEDDDRWFPGGVSIPAALAAAVALQVAEERRVREAAVLRALVDRVRARVAAEVPDVDVVGHAHDRLPHVVTFSCLYVDGEALVTELDARGFGVGSGSACTSSALEPSHVLAAMGVLTHGNVRLVLPTGTTGADVDGFLATLPSAVATVRASLGVEGL